MSPHPGPGLAELKLQAGLIEFPERIVIISRGNQEL